MPRYDYRCASCGRDLEVVQPFHEPALTQCPECGAEGLRKVFGSVGVVFKGSGFYRTDSREAAKKSAAKAGGKGGAAGKDTAAGKDAAATKTGEKSAASGESGTAAAGSAKAAAGKGSAASD